MNSKIRINNKYKYIFLVIVCIILIGLPQVSDKGPKFLRVMANYTVVPIQKGLSGFSNYIGSQIGKFDTYKELQKENETLKKEVENLNYANQKLSQNAQELSRLKSLYQMSEYYSNYETIGANVIGKGDEDWFNSFVIDKGSDDGIKTDMNVITKGGLVGIVTNTGHHYANVRSVIDDDSNVSAVVSSTGDLCIVKGNINLVEEGRISFDEMDNNDNNIKIGDEVVTSQISSKFVPGLLIGHIAEIKVSSNNLTRNGFITPAVDFSDIHEVLVITKKKEIGDTSGDN